jgi:hypothetical protein
MSGALPAQPATTSSKAVPKKIASKKPAGQTKAKAQSSTAADSHQSSNIVSLGDNGGYEESLDNMFSSAAAVDPADSISLQQSENSDRTIDEETRRLIAMSWKELKEHEENCKNGVKKNNEEKEEGAAEFQGGPGSAEGPQAKKSNGFWGRMSFGSSKGKHGEGKEGEAPSSSKKDNGKDKNGSNGNTFDIPQTFKEMCLLNAGMTGANLKYIETVESCFERIVGATTQGDYPRLESEANIMALRIHKDVKGKLVLREFKTCMLASLRSLLPKSWSISHEAAWSTMWDMVQAILTTTLPLPGKYEKAVNAAIADMSEEDKKKYGLNAFNRFFAKQKKAEDHFNTSNARLSVLAIHGLELCADIYKEPTRLCDMVTSLGLKHIMYNISVEYFDAFVEAMVEELECWVKDPNAVAGVEWAMTQIAAIMIYTIREGSNPLLQAVITNNQKKVRAALAPLAKKDRAATCLGAQGQMVGTTSGYDDRRK